MTRLVANSQLDMYAFLTQADLLGLFQAADVLVHGSTTFQIKDVDDTQEVLTLTGSFGGYNSDLDPTTGTVTGGSYSPGNTGFGSFGFSGASISVADFTGYVNANNMAGLFEQVLQGNDQIIGSPLGDILYGFNGNDTLDGGQGNDILLGGSGDDTYVVDSSADSILESPNQGTDTVQASVSFTLQNEVENLTLTGTAAISGTGNSASNLIVGNSAANTLDGAGGADQLKGGAGNDTYIVDNVGDSVTENPGEGVDTVNASVSYTLGPNLENLTLTGTAAINGTGNEQDNILVGNDGANTLDGGAGKDVLSGGKDNDVLQGGPGNDVFKGVDPNTSSAVQTGTNRIDGGDYGAGITNTVQYSGIRLDYTLHVTPPGAGDGSGFAIDVRNKGADSDHIINWSELDFAGGTTIHEADLAKAGVISFALWSLEPAFEAIHDYVGKLQEFLGTPDATKYPDAVKFLEWYGVAEQLVSAFSDIGPDTLAGDYKSALKVLVDHAVDAFTQPIIDEAVKQMKDLVDKVPDAQLKQQMDSLIDDGAKDLRFYIDGATNSVLNTAIDSAQNLQQIDWPTTWDHWMDAVQNGLTQLYQQVPGMSDPTTEFDDPHLTPTVPDAPPIQPPSPTPSTDDHIILGSNSDDFSYPGDGNDIVLALGGNDVVIAGHGGGDDVYDGGTGFDEIRFQSAQLPINIDLGAGTAEGTEIGHDVVLGFERVLAGAGDDLIKGSAAAEELNGGDGNDIVDGKSGDDVLAGQAGHDTLTGGAGNDTFKDTAAGLNGDTITDLRAGDRIVITDAALAGFTYGVSGNILTYTGGSVTIGSVGHLIASAAAGGGVQLTLRDVGNDFDGDGRSDLLWRSDTGQLTEWLGTASGGLSSNAANAFATVPTGWHVVGTADVNGDGRDDILWRNDDGRITDWLANANGGFAASTTFSTTVSNAWHVAGTGDFNGDGKDDILWRNDNGTITDWLANGSGGFTASTTFSTTVANSWHVVGTADFNGDGRDDILWRNDNGQLTDWLRTADGGFVSNVYSVYVPTNWTVAATGDFNGDGYSDVLWRSDTGQMTDWLGSAAGTLSSNGAASTYVPTNWQVVEVGDFNGDGRDDILWRSDTGQLTDWLGTTTGGAFTANSANLSTFVATSWHVQDAHAHGLLS